MFSTYIIYTLTQIIDLPLFRSMFQTRILHGITEKREKSDWQAININFRIWVLELSIVCYHGKVKNQSQPIPDVS